MNERPGGGLPVSGPSRETIAPAPANGVGAMNEMILLIEDDDAIAEMVLLHLEKSGYRLRRESDGQRALRMIEQQRWDLVLLDLTLPGADGWDICRHLRDRHPATPVIIVSARDAEIHRVLGLELGADDYLVKPFSMLELTARIRALLRRVERSSAAAPAETAIAFSGFCIDPVGRVLRRKDGAESVELTLREFDLLCFLARHPQKTFSRTSLLERVWGSSFDGYEHTVNSHIHRLRTKIEADPRNPRIIQTVWGLGYRFMPNPPPLHP